MIENIFKKGKFSLTSLTWVQLHWFISAKGLDQHVKSKKIALNIYVVKTSPHTTTVLVLQCINM